jgi:hypothetical protein
MFWNPVMNRISVSADYQLDHEGTIQSPFDIKLDGPLSCDLVDTPLDGG